MDVVYVLGTKSRWDNNEIRYSLRSIEKHLLGYQNIYVVGPSIPNWLKGVSYIYKQDQFQKEKNIALAILAACHENSISDRFLYFNDDHFLIRNIQASEFPTYAKDVVYTKENSFKPQRNRYLQAFVNTMRSLEERGLTNHCFEHHAPIILEKSKYIELAKEFDFQNMDKELLPRTLYGNYFKLPFKVMSDLKFGQRFSRRVFLVKSAGRIVFSVGQNAIGPNFINLASELYPNKSKWEV